MFKIQTKHVIKLILLAFFFCNLPSEAAQSDVSNYVYDLSDRILDINKTSEDVNTKLHRLKKVIADNVELCKISHFLIGKELNKYTPSEAKQFISDCNHYIKNKYANLLTLYEGKTKVTKVKQIADNTFVVDCKITLDDGTNMFVSYFILQQDNKYTIFDVLIAGKLRLAITTKAEFKAVIKEKGFDELMLTLRSAN